MKNPGNKEETFGYPQKVINLLNDPKFFGRMNDPTASSYLKGPCGDSMEFYLVIEDKKISDIKYYTDGCGATRACAAMVAYLAYGRTVSEALGISAGEVTRRLKGLPDDHLHCSILAVSTLYRAIADYLLAN
ncbi:MAG: iron-sulfur cluster assembly scaffold protein [Candidatus Omnitrophica bacterium]|nr:iron-sulfur cluster assembly scaffold protein [Candidatus Omnitrophota bacterium]MDD5655134.1 iron-sulfur cluster assembly scaffold protein [Candidatus Omnitrophota bacterium]